MVIKVNLKLLPSRHLTKAWLCQLTGIILDLCREEKLQEEQESMLSLIKKFLKMLLPKSSTKEASNMTFIARDESGWNELYYDEKIQKYFEKIYPNSDRHGGGEPIFRKISK